MSWSKPLRVGFPQRLNSINAGLRNLNSKKLAQERIVPVI